MATRSEKRFKGEGKKAYRAPRLATYGNLQRLTTGAKGGPASDSNVEVPVKSKATGNA